MCSCSGVKHARALAAVHFVDTPRRARRAGSSSPRASGTRRSRSAPSRRPESSTAVLVLFCRTPRTTRRVVSAIDVDPHARDRPAEYRGRASAPPPALPRSVNHARSFQSRGAAQPARLDHVDRRPARWRATNFCSICASSRKRLFIATMRMRSCSYGRVAPSVCASVALRASGFSHRTSRPERSAAMRHGRVQVVGRAQIDARRRPPSSTSREKSSYADLEAGLLFDAPAPSPRLSRRRPPARRRGWR